MRLNRISDVMKRMDFLMEIGKVLELLFYDYPLARCSNLQPNLPLYTCFEDICKFMVVYHGQFKSLGSI